MSNQEGISNINFINLTDDDDESKEATGSPDSNSIKISVPANSDYRFFDNVQVHFFDGN